MEVSCAAFLLTHIGLRSANCQFALDSEEIKCRRYNRSQNPLSFITCDQSLFVIGFVSQRHSIKISIHASPSVIEFRLIARALGNVLHSHCNQIEFEAFRLPTAELHVTQSHSWSSSWRSGDVSRAFVNYSEQKKAMQSRAPFPRKANDVDGWGSRAKWKRILRSLKCWKAPRALFMKNKKLKTARYTRNKDEQPCHRVLLFSRNRISFFL